MKFQKTSYDSKVCRELNDIGWEAVVVWECELKSNKDRFGPFVGERLGLRGLISFGTTWM